MLPTKSSRKPQPQKQPLLPKKDHDVTSLIEETDPTEEATTEAEIAEAIEAAVETVTAGPHAEISATEAQAAVIEVPATEAEIEVETEIIEAAVDTVAAVVAVATKAAAVAATEVVAEAAAIAVVAAAADTEGEIGINAAAMTTEAAAEDLHDAKTTNKTQPNNLRKTNRKTNGSKESRI